MIAPQPYDPTGATVVVDKRSWVFAGHSPTRSGPGSAQQVIAGSGPFAVTGGKVAPLGADAGFVSDSGAGLSGPGRWR